LPTFFDFVQVCEEASAISFSTEDHKALFITRRDPKTVKTFNGYCIGTKGDLYYVLGHHMSALPLQIKNVLDVMGENDSTVSSGCPTRTSSGGIWDSRRQLIQRHLRHMSRWTTEL
jgi:hypothetical protein